MSDIALMHLDSKLLDIVHSQIGNRLFTFALSQLCKPGDSNQESGLADSLLMLVAEEL